MSPLADILARMSANGDIPPHKVGLMQLHNILSSSKSAVFQSLNRFRGAVNNFEVWRPTEDIQFVFLCGANLSPGKPSKRRQILLDFSHKNLPHTKFFLAELIFDVLEAEGHSSNFLDIEGDLSKFSDFVIVVLESESSFCELGAFSMNKDLRKKLIIINDVNHKKSKSFINFGPVKAVSEISNGLHVLFYEMEENGKEFGDAIGDVFTNLHSLLSKKPGGRRERIKEYNPNDFFSKDSLRFVHDLVYFSNPISISELSRVIKIIFKNCKDSQLKKHLALLCAIGQVRRTTSGYYISQFKKAFFEYEKIDVTDLIATFRLMYFKYDDSRLKEL